MSYMKQNKKHKQTLESAQYGLEIIFNPFVVPLSFVYSILERFWSVLVSGKRWANSPNFREYHSGRHNKTIPLTKPGP